MAENLLASLAGFLASPNIMSMQIILFFVALVIGYILAKVVKVMIVVGIIILVGYYLGFISINEGQISRLAEQYGPAVMQGILFAVSSLVFGLGLVIGFIAGMLR
ncbi:MAG TPA: hypothetical protein EYH45_03450 [Candidatus Caldiarchaeum subterraneum]|uniref:Uncharacterized protein n=1 Tax=Caldiarchaeum subterraneum TaxID=311458 RepID=A0A833EC99_CALS0|nr:hypothetical protein [Candidatus Caldarchaeum subterraneum]